MRYTETQLEFLREGYLAMRISELTEAFNAAFGLDLSPSAVNATLKNHKFRCGRTGGHNKGVGLEYTQEQEQFVREHYPHMSRSALTAAFNESFGKSKTIMQVISFAKRCGITSGRSGHFMPGSLPWNTGTKGMIAPNSGQFKPGQVPPNLKDIGFERVNVYGYIEIKIAEANPYTGVPTRFKMKQQVVWEAANGPIPKGSKIRFLDGDKLNCALENLELVSNAENFRMNQTGYADVLPEMKPVARKIVALEVTAFRRLKESRS